MPFIKERFKECRISAKLTLEEVALKVGVKPPTIQRYESGVISNIDTLTIEKLASAVGCEPAYLVGWQEKPFLNQPCLSSDYDQLDKADKSVVDIVIQGLLSSEKYLALSKRKQHA